MCPLRWAWPTLTQTCEALLMNMKMRRGSQLVRGLVFHGPATSLSLPLLSICTPMTFCFSVNLFCFSELPSLILSDENPPLHSCMEKRMLIWPTANGNESLHSRCSRERRSIVPQQNPKQEDKNLSNLISYELCMMAAECEHCAFWWILFISSSVSAITRRRLHLHKYSYHWMLNDSLLLRL